MPNFIQYIPPEISARRLSQTLDLFQELYPSKRIELLLDGKLDDALLIKIRNDRNFWISSEIEELVLNTLDSEGSLQELMFQVGKDFFLSRAFDLLPTDDSIRNYHQLMFNLPVLLAKINRFLDIKPEKYDDNSIEFNIEYFPGGIEKWYDLIFILGIFEGAKILFHQSDAIIKYLSVRIPPEHVSRFKDPHSIRFGSYETILRAEWTLPGVSVGKTYLKDIQPTEGETFIIVPNNIDGGHDQSYLDLRSLIEKSKELYLEKRDLEAAVEVLSSLRNELVVKQKSITKDLKMASNIQKGIIPQKIPDWQGLQFAVDFTPMQEVSGDYYDYFNFGSNKLGILVSDVSGHGVPAAFITAISKLLFSNYKLDSPSEIFGNANNELIELIKQQGYLTCFYGIIDSEYQITYSIAGHPRPILYKYKSKEVSILEGEGTFLGMFSDAREHFKDYVIKLEPGDKLYVYTDGIVEGQSDKGEQFGQERLIECIIATAEMDVRSSVDYIMKEFNNFCVGTDQGDDLTLLGMGLSLHLEEFVKLKTNGENYFEEGNYEKACEQMYLAHKILPNDLQVLLLMGKYYTKSKKYNEAIKFLDEYNTHKTYNADAHLISGYCYYKIDNYGKAEMEFQKSVSLRRDNIPAFYNLAKTYYKQRQYGRSQEFLRKILNSNPGHPLAKRASVLLQKNPGQNKF